MMQKKAIRQWLLLVMAFTLAPTLAFHAAEQGDWPRLSRWLEWRGVAGPEKVELRILVLNQLLDDRQVTRILADSSAPFRLILSEEQYLLEGTRRVTLRDPQTGWWLELVEDSGMKMETAIQAADPGLFALKLSQLIEQDYEGRMTWQARGTPQFAEAIRLWKDDAYAGFASRLWIDDRAGVLIDGIPPADRLAIRHLASLPRGGEAGSSMERFRSLLTTLVMILDRHAKSAPSEPSPAVSWQLADSKFHYEDFFETHERALVNTFEGVSAVDPLADLKAASPPEIHGPREESRPAPPGAPS